MSQKKWLANILLAVLALSGWLGFSPSAAHSADLVVSAAASLQEAFSEIKKEYEARHPADKILLNLGGSGSLAAQITHGAPCDVFVSADEEQMNLLQKKNLLNVGSRRDLAGNALVVIVKDDKNAGRTFNSIKDLLSLKRLAIGNPQTVPAGRYAMSAFKFYKVDDALRKSNALVQAENVRQVLSYVESGNVDAGLVYATDAAIGHGTRIQFSVPLEATGAITYPIAVLKDSRNQTGAQQFVELAAGAFGQKILSQRGFKTALK